jgi:signal peptidase I, bacterial type
MFVKKTKGRFQGVSIKVTILALVLAAVIPSIVFQMLLMFMYVPSDSMSPTFSSRDTLFGTRIFSSINRGEIVAFQAGDIVMIKRVIGLSGETVYINETGAVFVDGNPLDESYVKNQRSGKSQTFVVPDNCILLLGDNRANSFDARYWDNPYVSVEAVLAIAKYNTLSGRLE